MKLARMCFVFGEATAASNILHTQLNAFGNTIKSRLFVVVWSWAWKHLTIHNTHTRAHARTIVLDQRCRCDDRVAKGIRLTTKQLHVLDNQQHFNISPFHCGSGRRRCCWVMMMRLSWLTVPHRCTRTKMPSDRLAIIIMVKSAWRADFTLYTVILRINWVASRDRPPTAYRTNAKS